MKFLYDCVYTGKPSTCSSSYVAWKVIEEIASHNPTAFFYLTVPETHYEDEEQQAFWKVQKYSERVTLFPVDQMVIDRMSALLSYPQDIANLVTPTNEKTWDTDVIITTRIPQIAMHRANSSRSVGFGKGTYRAVIGLDDIPMLEFRDTVAWGNTGHFCAHTLNQYAMADGIVLSDLWTKQKAVQRARQIYSPSRVKELDAHIREALPVKLETLKLRKKSPKQDPFNVVFTGRMTGTRNFQEVAELFRKHFAYAIGKGHVKFIVSTQSQALGGIDPGEIDFIEFEYNNREQFHELLQKRAHVVVNLSTVEDFSLSTYEPLLFGVPVIVPERPWTSFLGPDYPFRAKDFVSAYALVKLFIEDYAGQYKRFREWHDSYWKGLVQSPRNRATAETVRTIVEEHFSSVSDKLAEGKVGGKFHEIADKIDAQGAGEVDILAFLKAEGLIQWHKDWKGIPLTKKPNLHLLKLILNLRGWQDTKEAGVIFKE